MNEHGGLLIAEEDVITQVAQLIEDKDKVIRDLNVKWNAEKLEAREIENQNGELAKVLQIAQEENVKLRRELEAMRHKLEIRQGINIEQQEEPLKIEPFSEETAAWFENRDGCIFPLLLRAARDHAEGVSLSGWPFGKKFRLWLDAQGITWRLWRRRPTEAERKAARWKDETDD